MALIAAHLSAEVIPSFFLLRFLVIPSLFFHAFVPIISSSFLSRFLSVIPPDFLSFMLAFLFLPFHILFVYSCFILSYFPFYSSLLSYMVAFFLAFLQFSLGFCLFDEDDDEVMLNVLRCQLTY